MEDQGLPLDRISSLPSNITKTILTLMPIKDAFKTSILSRNWRYHCIDIPKLKFDYTFHASVGRRLPNAILPFAITTAGNSTTQVCNGVHVVYLILLLHQGPILEFSFYVPQHIGRWEIDQVILHLSRKADTLKEFSLWIGSANYRLLPTFFNLQHLTVLKLQKCVFLPPVTFKGFSRLVTLSFSNVSITAEVFQRFISSCPLLKDVTLIGDEKQLTGRWNSTMLKCLSSVDRLCMVSYPIKIVHHACLILKHLHLVGPSIPSEISLFSAISLVICSSPTIETFIMELQHIPARSMTQTVIIYDQSAILHHLRLIKVINFINMKTGMDFLKFILAKSPMLKDAHIVINTNVDIQDEVKMLKELLRYPRASTRAEIRFERP